jgi:NAD(P)-dependent dehydrogenase (short-subunit alcohol dehydrogenase family)
MGLLEGRKALVTGGASGIGLATVRRLAAEGASVVVVDRDKERGDAAAASVGGSFVAADVSDPSQVKEAFAEAARLLGGLDIAHLNAGIALNETDVGAVSLESYRRILSINVDGVFFGVQEAIGTMSGGFGGSSRPPRREAEFASGGDPPEIKNAIVATASIAGLNSYPPDPVYALTKHAVVGLVRALGADLASKGITINCVCPGVTDTPLLGDAAEQLRATGFPLIAPEDIAEAVVRAVTSGESGQAWVVQPGREPMVYGFRGIPGPRTPGAEGMLLPYMKN